MSASSDGMGWLVVIWMWLLFRYPFWDQYGSVIVEDAPHSLTAYPLDRYLHEVLPSHVQRSTAILEGNGGGTE